MIPGFERYAGPFGPSTATATACPLSTARFISRIASKPLRLLDARSGTYPSLASVRAWMSPAQLTAVTIAMPHVRKPAASRNCRPCQNAKSTRCGSTRAKSGCVVRSTRSVLA